MEQNSKKDFLINFSFTAIIGAIVFIVAKFILQYLTPFVLAVIIAYLMQKPAKYIESKFKISKGISALVLSAGVYILVAFFIIFSVYRLFLFSGELTRIIPDFLTYVENLTEKIQETFYGFFENSNSALAEEFISAFKGSIRNFALEITDSASHLVAKTAKNIPSFMLSSIVAFVASCYIAKDYDRLNKFFKGICSAKVYSNIVKIKEILGQSVFKLLKGYILIMVLTYIELLIGFFVLGIKYAPIAALLVAIVDLLPVLGTGTVLLPWGIILIASGNSFKGFGILVLYLVITLIRNFCEPKIIGSQIGINPLFTLIAMFVGLKVFGFWGIFIFPVVFIVTVKYYKNEIEADKI